MAARRIRPMLGDPHTAAWQELPLPGAQLRYAPAWLSTAEADAAFAALRAELPWTQQSIRVFGKEHLQPRLSVWMGDPGTDYRYSGRLFAPTPWTPTAAALRARLCQGSGRAFNCLLANLYRDGQDSMGWHSDDEPELGPEPQIASLSLGAARDFRLRPRPPQRGPAHSLRLQHGSLLLMEGRTQRHWQHALPRRARCSDARINLTFRWIPPSNTAETHPA